MTKNKFSVPLIAALTVTFLMLGTAPAIASVQTDRYLYNFGDTVQITGDGMAASEVVAVDVYFPNASLAQHHEVAADEFGNFSDSFYLAEGMPGGIYDVVATGLSSGIVFTTQFDPAPAAPNNVGFIDGRFLASPTGITVQWAAASGANCYYVYRSTSPLPSLVSVSATGFSCSSAPAGVYAIVAAPGTSFTDPQAAVTTVDTYFYYVATVQNTGSVGNQGRSANSNQVRTDSMSPSPNSHDFGSVALSGSSAHLFTVTNNSGTSIRFRSISMSGPNAADFTVSGQPGVNTTVNNGTSFTFALTFAPGAAGARSATIAVNTNSTQGSASSFDTRLISVAGTGVGVTDTDGDGVPDSTDNCPSVANPGQANADGDTLGDACDANSFAPQVDSAASDANGLQFTTLTTSGSFSDADGNHTLTITKVSGVGTVTDNGDGTWSWSYLANTSGSGTVVVQASDGEHTAAQDSFGWTADPDADADGITDPDDNCPSVANPGQANADGDTLGDACDANSFAPQVDSAASDANGLQFTTLTTSGSFSDADGNHTLTITKVSGVGTVTDNGDGTWSWSYLANTSGSGTVVVQASDGEHTAAQDSFGWTADPDADADGITDPDDNCPSVANPGQANADGDTLGDACDANSFAPQVDSAASDANGDEGDTLTTSGSFSDADGNDTLTITKLSGVGTVTDNGDGTWSWSLATTDNGSGSVTVSAGDGEHTAATDTFDWSAVNVAPTIAISGDANVNEGSSYSLTLGTITDPGADTVTSWVVHWGDGSSNTYSTGGAKTHTYADGPNDHDITVDLTDEDDTFLDAANAKSVHVNNVAPTIAISGDANVNEGSSYSLTLGTITDPGADTVTSWVVHWGDGSSNTYSTGGAKTHTYADGPNDHDITVDLTDEDDTFLDAANAKSVHVNNVAPTIAISGDANVNEGSSYSLTLGTITDPGADTVTSWVVHWGDGSSNTYSTGGAKTHTYADGPNDHDITVDLTDEDDTFLDAANAKSVHVNNVAPTVTIDSLTGNSGTACIAGNTVTLGFLWTDPAGANDTYSYSIAWGDGSTTPLSGTTTATSPESGLTHTYAAGGPYTIVVTVNDSDPGGGGTASSGAFSFLYNASGVLQPVNDTQAHQDPSIFKYGSTVPVKIRVVDCNGTVVSGLTPQIKVERINGSAPTTGENEATSTSSADTGTTMRDAGAGQYIYNLATKTLSDSSATYRITITGPFSTVTAFFGTKPK